MKIWISKYALSGKITEHECEPPKVGSSDVYPGAPFASYVSFELGKDAHETHETREGAVDAAKTMRKAKIASLRKQIEKLEAKTF